jgi:hypothetical protein
LIAFALGMKNYEALSYVCKFLGLEEGSVEHYEKSEALSQIKKFKRSDFVAEEKVLDEHILERYKKRVVEDWVEEGIDEAAQNEFEVLIDEKEKRWCFALRNPSGKLIGIKGRTYVKDYKVLRIPKYFYYYSKGSLSNLYNLHRAKKFAEECGELIIVESEKSVMKLWATGIYNVVAIGNKKVSTNIMRQILSVNCKNLVFALDKDVLKKDVKVESSKFRLFRNCFLMIDTKKLLDEKDSPCDKGFLVWEELYNNRERA